LQPTVNVTINDIDGNNTVVDIYTSTDGSSWVNRQHTASHTANTSISYSYTQASAYNTLYYWKVAANDGHTNSTAIYYFTTMTNTSSIPSTGQPVTISDFVTWNGADIYVKGDNNEGNDTFILNDNANISAVIWANFTRPGTSHHQMVAGSITKSPVNNTYYIIVRERWNSTIRGRNWTAYKNTGNLLDSSDWVKIWTLDRRDVSNLPTATYSIERCNIRYYNGSYYFYFTVAIGNTFDWKVYYVKASTVEQVYNQLSNYNNWHQISLDGYYRLKDPWTGYDGSQYILWTGKSTVSSSNGMAIFVADNPEFNNKTEVWNDTKSGRTSDNTGCIFFDNSSGNYIMWTNLTSWTKVDQWDMGFDNDTTGNMRYMDYYKESDNRIVLIMEYDLDEYNNSNELVVWDYNETTVGFTDSGTAEPMTFPDTLPNSGIWVNATSNFLAITNNYGTIDGTNSWVVINSAVMESEAGEMIYTGGSIHIWVKINDGNWHNVTARDANGYYIVNDSVWNYTFGEGDVMYIREEVFIDDSPGTDPAGTYTTSNYPAWGYPGFWQVVNSTSNITSLNYWNATITLTNAANTPPVVPNTPNPADGSTDVSYNNPSLSFHTGDNDSTYLQCSLYLNDSLVNSKYVENLTSNMTISISVPQILDAGKTYTWYIKVSDGTDTVTGPVWQFTTANATSNEPPLVYSPSPANGATNISLLPTLSVLVYDTDSDSISVTFYDSNNITIGIDTFVNQMPPSPGQASVQWNDVILSNQTYEWYAMADDGDGNVVRYPTIGYLNFTTGITYPPVVTFQVKDTSGFPLSDVNISCSNLNQQILQYATTNTGGFFCIQENQLYHCKKDLHNIHRAILHHIAV